MLANISIVIPIFNAAKYLHLCITSIVSQSFKNWELILINDGSTDGSGKICDEYALKDKRIQVFHQENMGVTIARKNGVALSSGEYICFVDADDTLPENSLKLLYTAAQKHELEILITAKNRVINGKLRKIENEIEGIVTNKELIEAYLFGNCFIGPHGRLTARNLFDDKTFEIPVAITQNEDLLMNINLACNASRIGIFNSIVPYNFIFRKGSTSTHKKPYDMWLEIFDKCEEIIRANNLSSLYYALDHYKLSVIRNFLFSRKKIPSSEIEKIKETLKSLTATDLSSTEKEVLFIIKHLKSRPVLTPLFQLLNRFLANISIKSHKGLL
nr:glycosyltransferase family 2 protein [uncultured Desulfobacter sp.]